MDPTAPATSRRERAIADEAAVVTGLYRRLDDVTERTEADLLRARRGQTAGTPAARTEQEAFVRLYAERLAALRAAEHRLCFGRLDLSEGAARYIGRVGLVDDAQQPLLIDWRAPAAEPFYQATAAHPRGVVRRRHILTEGRTVTAIEDDVLDLSAVGADGRLGDDDVQGGGVLMAALGARRTGRMHDIVATLQAEQDRIVRAPMPGILVVEGAPGCGKTVVALHRAAYLLYTHRDRLASQGVLIVGPNPIFLHYIEQVLPALGETAAVLTTPGRLFPGVDAVGEESDEVAVLKGDRRMVDVVGRAVRARQRVPARPMDLTVGSSRIRLTPGMVAQARDRARSTRRPHNLARRTFALTLLERLAVELARVRGVDVDSRREDLIADLRESPDVRREVNLAWMPLTPQQLVGDLWARPEVLAEAAPQMSAGQRAALYRPRAMPWTVGDVPLLDEAAELLGVDDEAERREQARRAADRRAEVEYAQSVVEMTGARGVSAESIIDRYAGDGVRLSVSERAEADREWVFGHVVVDEAQELTPMMWRVLARRCPGLSMTVVGDLDQAASAGVGSWDQVLGAIARPRQPGEKRWRSERLTVNYRTPQPIMSAARAVLAATGREPAPVESVREGVPPRIVPLAAPADPSGVVDIVAQTVRDPDLGRLGVIAARRDHSILEASLSAALPGLVGHGAQRLTAPVSVLTVAQAKGLEFDVVVIVEPAAIEAEAAVRGRDLYVALTRATREVIVAHSDPLPLGL